MSNNERLADARGCFSVEATSRS